MHSPIRIGTLALALLAAWTTTAWAVEWESVKSASGTVKNTVVKTGGGNNNRNNNKNGKNNNSNYRVKPVYVEFAVTGPGMKISFETNAAGDRPQLKMELEKEITKSNGDKDWQRVGIIGRARGDGKGEAGFASGPGNYRIEMTGQNTKYSISVEQPVKK